MPSYSTTTAGTTLTKIGKQVHRGVLKAFARRDETWKSVLTRLKADDIDFSQRSVTTTIDIVPQGVGAFIDEFGIEANPKTAAPQDLTFTFVNYNDRATFSRTAEYLDKNQRGGLLVKNAKWAAMKMLEGFTKRMGIGFYGTNTGELFQFANNDASSAGPTNYAITRGFGQTTITDQTYLLQFVSPGDYLGAVSGGALVANGIGLVNSTSSSGINITWSAAVDPAQYDSLVFANQYKGADTTVALSRTEYVAAPGTKSPNGLMDFALATTVHGLSGSTYPNWMPALGDTAGGDLTGTKLKKGQHLIKNAIGGTADTLIMAQGVSRRLYQTTQSAVHFNDPLGMEILGSVKTGSIKQIDNDPLCPPGWAFLMDKSYFYRWNLIDLPDVDSPEGLQGQDNVSIDKVQDYNGSAVSFDFPFQNVTKGRGALAYWNGLTEA